MAKSEYTRTQVHAARAALRLSTREADRAGEFGIGEGLTRHGQISVDATLRQITPAIVRDAATPLVRLHPWLAPLR